MNRAITIGVLMCSSAMMLACGGSPVDNSQGELPPNAAFTVYRNTHAAFQLEINEPLSGHEYHWELGDGRVAEGTVLDVEYSQSGPFTVSLVATNSLGDTANSGRTVYVRNTPPIAAFGVQFNDLVVTLDASQSFDVDKNIQSYQWSVNGQAYSGQRVDIALQAPGDLSVELTVFDSFGEASDPVVRDVSVTGGPNTAPMAVIDTLVSRAYVRLLGANSFDADGDMLTLRWIMEDGSEYSGDNVVHEFAQTGLHEVTLEVSDGKETHQTSTMVEIVELDAPGRALYGKALYTASLELLRRCGYCHQQTSPILNNFLDLDVLDNELTSIVQARSPLWVYSFPSEQNGLMHQGMLSNFDRFVDAGDRVTDQLDVWHDLISGIAETLGLEHNF